MSWVYVGTYAGQIYLYDLDPTRAELQFISAVAAERDPSYLAFGPAGQTLYAVNEQVEDGGVSAFAVDQSSGQLMFVNRMAAHGADPAHLSVDPSGGWVLVANYTGGTIAVMPIQSDGSLGEATHVVQHAGSGPNQQRQQGPHPHMIVADPAGEFVLVPDLGTDTVVAYRLDRDSGQLVAQPEAGGRLPPGAGPRHTAFSADGRHAYVLDELDSTLAAFEYEATSGQMVQNQVVSTLPADFSGTSYPAAIVVAPSGRFVYCSNRGHDSVAIFALDDVTGRPTPQGHTPTGGSWPRDINLDPTGSFLLAANQKSDSIVVFRVDQERGTLEATGQVAQVPQPARVLFSA